MVERYFRKEANERVLRLQQANEIRTKEIDHKNKYSRDEAKKHQLETLIQATEADIAKIKQAHGNELTTIVFFSRERLFWTGSMIGRTVPGRVEPAPCS